MTPASRTTTQQSAATDLPDIASKSKGRSPWAVAAACLRAVLGCALLIAAVAKAEAPAQATRMITALVEDGQSARGIVLASVLAEWAAGVLLLSGFAARIGLWITAILIVCATAVVLIARQSGFTGDCGCTGSLRLPGESTPLIRNAVLIAMIAVAILLESASKGDHG